MGCDGGWGDLVVVVGEEEGVGGVEEIGGVGSGEEVEDDGDGGEGECGGKYEVLGGGENVGG